MVEYGNTLEPGIVTEVESALNVSVSGGAPADVGIVGQADLGGATNQGSADPNTVYQVTRAPDARNWFGEDSLLTSAIVDALAEDAYPVYAVAAEKTTVSDEDLSGLTSTSGNFANAPVVEDGSQVTFTIDGTEFSTRKVYDDPGSYSPEVEEAIYNPVEGSFELASAPSDADDTNDTVAYAHFDYQTAIDALESGAGDAIDFLVPLSENNTVTDYAQTVVGNMAQEHKFAMTIISPGARIDVDNYENRYDDSRVLLVYPSRNADDESTLGSYAGIRARLGISTTPIEKTLSTQKNLAVRLDKSDRGTLIDNRVVPLDQKTAGARIADDVNSVSDDNTEEANIRYGFSRLVFDYAIQTIRVNEKPFIGKLNSPSIRNALQGLLNTRLRTLENSNAIISYEVRVVKIDNTTVGVDLQINGAEPIRFIENTVTIQQ